MKMATLSILSGFANIVVISEQVLNNPLIVLSAQTSKIGNVTGNVTGNINGNAKRLGLFILWWL